MSRSGRPHVGVVYPTPDDQPMADTEVHGECMMYVPAEARTVSPPSGVPQSAPG